MPLILISVTGDLIFESGRREVKKGRRDHKILVFIFGRGVVTLSLKSEGLDRKKRVAAKNKKVIEIEELTLIVKRSLEKS